MKNLIITLTIIFCSINSFGQDTTILQKTSSTISTLADSSKLSFSKVYTDVKAGITGLAAALKIGAEHVYVVLVRQQIVNAVIWLIVGIIACFLILNWFKKYNSSEKWKTDDYMSDPTGLGFMRTVQISLACCMFIVFLFNLDTIVMGFVNPEYGAIKEIINFVK